MMRTLRDKTTMQIILWLLVAAFIGTIFFAWGMKYTGGGHRDPNVVAQVGDMQITYNQFNQLYRPALDKLYGSQSEGPTQDETDRLQREVLDQMVDDAILQQTARKLGIGVSNEELAGSIQHMPYFLDQNGRFDKNRYFQILQANEITVQQFESSQRQQILMQKIRALLTGGILYSNDEVDHFASLLNRDLKADYVALDPAVYQEGVTASESDLRDFYETHKSSYDRPERAKVRHILVRTGGDEAKAKAELEKFRKEILSGKAKFADLAKKYSQDGGSKDQGGELGWITRGEMVKPFEDAVFGLKKGQVTQPFKTQYGYHIAQLEDYQKAYKSTFAEVRGKVLLQYKKQKAQEAILSLAERLADKLKKEDLRKAAGELSLSVHTTDWFNRKSGIPSLKGSKDLADQLAGLELTDWKGPLPFDVKEYFFQIVDARPGKTAPLAEAERADIAQRLSALRQQEWMKDFLAARKKALHVQTFLKS